MNDTIELPKVGELYEHRGGYRYMIQAITNEKTSRPHKHKYPVTVVYRNIQTQQMWSRPVDEWHRSFTHIPKAMDYSKQEPTDNRADFEGVRQWSWADRPQ